MLGRLAPQSDSEREAVAAVGLDIKRILTSDELISGDQLFFAATGITDGPLLGGVLYHGDHAETQSLVLRCDTRAPPDQDRAYRGLMIAEQVFCI